MQAERQQLTGLLPFHFISVSKRRQSTSAQLKKAVQEPEGNLNLVRRERRNRLNIHIYGVQRMNQIISGLIWQSSKALPE